MNITEPVSDILELTPKWSMKVPLKAWRHQRLSRSFAQQYPLKLLWWGWILFALLYTASARGVESDKHFARSLKIFAFS
ncbi:hypothetical protein [Marinomonas ostreistagni]|uniref:hypothetical protein n=1 Tax=Marinomonas ostreistagni TaxID=359209 RepID=UPI00194EB4A2|nr:hypothetical protein [Marinomonas ostreistagni]MBM6550353.1 hypothetical protein [Marinomonas ostreistagni]